MNKNKFLWMASSVIALVFASCANDEPVSVNKGREIAFRTSLTRGAEADLKSLKEDGFNVSAITDGKLYIDQVGFTFDKESGTWNGNDTYYWPGSDVEFYAYTPGSLSDKTIINSQQQTILGFEPNESVANQVDLITAYAKGNITEYS